MARRENNRGRHLRSQNAIRVSQILELTDEKPAIGQRKGENDKTHWIIFVKD